MLGSSITVQARTAPSKNRPGARIHCFVGGFGSLDAVQFAWNLRCNLQDECSDIVSGKMLARGGSLLTAG